MTNDIGITWTSDQKQLIADMQKRQLLQDAEIARLTKLAGVGAKAGQALAGGYKEVNRELDRLGRLAESNFKKPISAMDAHLARLKELRVLYRMGKIDADQMNQAAAGSKKQYYDEIGLVKRLRDEKKLAAQHDKDAQAHWAARRKFWDEEELRTRRQADQQAQVARSERNATQDFYAARRKYWDEESQKLAKQAEAVRKSLLSEKDLARANYQARINQLRDLHRAGQLTAAEMNQGIKQAALQLASLSKIDLGKVWAAIPIQLKAGLTIAGGIHAALRQARAEFENLKSMQKDAANTTITYAEAQSEAVQNLDNSMTAADLDESVMQIAKEQHMSPSFVMRAASGALGARGGSTAKEAMDAIRASIGFNRFNQGAANSTVTALLQAKAANPAASFNELLGQQKSAKIASPIRGDEDFSQYLVPGASGARAFGDTEQQFYGLAAHLGSRMGDTTGRVTGTATVDLQRDLATNPALRDVKDAGEGMSMARLRALAFDKRYAAAKARLLGEIQAQGQDELVRSGGRLTTEARSYGAIALLLQGDKDSWDQLGQKQKEVLAPGKESAALVQKQRDVLAGLPAQRTATAEMAVQGHIETRQLENQGAARGSISREALQRVLKVEGVANIEQLVQGLQFEVNSQGGQVTPAREAARLLRERANERSNRSIPVGGNLTYGPATGQYAERPETPAEKETRDAYRRVATLLEQLIGDDAAKPPVQVNVIVPGAAGDKPGVPAGAGLQGGKL